MSIGEGTGSAQGDFHLLAEEGSVIADFDTMGAGEAWRKEMRRRARGVFAIRTGRADQMPLRTWAVRLDATAGDQTMAPINLQRAFDDG
jgi:hypothetical protein